MAVHAEQAVIREEAQEAARRIVQHARDRGRPDRSRHRQQIPVCQAAAESLLRQELSNGRVVLGGGLEIAPAGLVEPANVQEHAQERGAHQVAALRQEGRQGAAAILERPTGDARRERHRAGLGGHAQMREHPGQERVGRLVVDQEPRVHRHGDPVERDRHGVGMAAQPRLSLENGDGVPPIQQPRGGKAGDAGADNSDPHLRILLPTPRWAATGFRDDKPAAPHRQVGPPSARSCYERGSRLDQSGGPVAPSALVKLQPVSLRPSSPRQTAAR